MPLEYILDNNMLKHFVLILLLFSDGSVCEVLQLLIMISYLLNEVQRNTESYPVFVFLSVAPFSLLFDKCQLNESEK